jgi:lipooligosaccharide transport system ATP-binding protein
LVAAHLERDVVEAYGTGAKDLARQPVAQLASRVETSGETVFFYTQDAAPLLHALGQMQAVRYLHRPANLEDLFLKLTGRQIREDA